MPRQKLAPRVIRVVYELDEGGSWHVYAPDLSGCRSDGRTIAAARRNIREAIAACDDSFASAAAVEKGAELHEEIRLPAKARKLVAEVVAERAAARKQDEKALDAAARAARALTHDVGLSLRDAGELLGLSHERVKQIAEVKVVARGRAKA